MLHFPIFLCPQYLIHRDQSRGKADIAGTAVALDCIANKIKSFDG